MTWHGTAGGYTNHGCRDGCCRTAWAAQMAQYRKRRYLHGPLRVSNLGTVRRLQALAVYGWTPTLIAEEMSSNARRVAHLRNGLHPTVYLTTHTRVAETYEALCMRFPPDTQPTRRQRHNAARLGWFPPLAYDDIDDPDEMPSVDEHEVAA